MKSISKSNRGEIEVSAAIVIIVVIILFFGGLFWAYPSYNVWSSQKAGEALLAHAQSSKEVAVAEARAKKESASLLADAEIERARGVAQANKIIGDSLKGNDSYLRYLWITEVAGKDVNKTVVYIPTEANVPIMEAGRTNKEEVNK